MGPTTHGSAAQGTGAKRGRRLCRFAVVRLPINQIITMGLGPETRDAAGVAAASGCLPPPVQSLPASARLAQTNREAPHPFAGLTLLSVSYANKGVLTRSPSIGFDAMFCARREGLGIEAAGYSLHFRWYQQDRLRREALIPLA